MLSLVVKAFTRHLLPVFSAWLSPVNGALTTQTLAIHLETETEFLNSSFGFSLASFQVFEG